MWRFTTRELIGATTICAILCGWWLDHGYMRIEVEKSRQWRGRAVALERILRTEGWNVLWDYEKHQVGVCKEGGRPPHYAVSTTVVATGSEKQHVVPVWPVAPDWVEPQDSRPDAQEK